MNRIDVFGNLEKDFRKWLKNVGFKAADHYVDNVKAIGEPIRPHMTVGECWNGLFEEVTGKKPAKGVFEVNGISEFSNIYGELVSFVVFEKEYKEVVRRQFGHCSNFDVIYDFVHSNGKSGTGDGGHTRSGFVKYLQFLAELESRVSNGALAATPLLMPLGSLQQISYGAPGTGKSKGVDKTTKRMPKEDVVRTTFHPDSDYSTFVGAYKPTMKTFESKVENQHLTIDQLAAILKSEYDSAGDGSDKGKALAVDLFAEKYYEYLDGAFGKVSLSQLVNKAGLTNGYTVGLRDSINVAKYHALQRRGEKRISYSFVPQAFAKAYVQAWKRMTVPGADGKIAPVMLVIEEINRGDCAKVFGDLFQLLDRRVKDDEHDATKKAGFSEYPVLADSDLAEFIRGELSGVKAAIEGLGYASVVAADKLELMLPPNMYIWATMNTSDQSLFPMDSAFKRRWDWKYMPIAKPDEPNWKDRKIKVGASLYDWWDFLTIINKHIVKATESEDKQLGYFFVKAPGDTGLITADQFANKVLFYLYGDVFKSYDLPAPAFKRDGGAVWAFRDFFYSETVVVSKVDGQIVKDVDGNVVKTVTDETTQMLKKPGDVNEFELAAFLDHLKWKDASGEKSVGKESAGADA